MDRLFIDVNEIDSLSLSRIFSSETQWNKCKSFTLYVSGFMVQNNSTMARLEFIRDFLTTLEIGPQLIYLKFNLQLIHTLPAFDIVYDYNEYWDEIVSTIIVFNSFEFERKLNIYFSSFLGEDQEEKMKIHYDNLTRRIWENCRPLENSPWSVDWRDCYNTQHECMRIIKFVMKEIPLIQFQLLNIFPRVISYLIEEYYFSQEYSVENCLKCLKRFA
jgi:hypothetical protein